MFGVFSHCTALPGVSRMHLRLRSWLWRLFSDILEALFSFPHLWALAYTKVLGGFERLSVVLRALFGTEQVVDMPNCVPGISDPSVQSNLPRLFFMVFPLSHRSPAFCLYTHVLSRH